MAGYYGWSMSNNAVDAYESGRLPLSKWTKTLILQRYQENFENEFDDEAELKKQISLLKKYKLAVLKKALLVSYEWHHTSKMFNATDFYDVLVYEQIDGFRGLLEVLTEASQELGKEKRSAAIPEKWHVRYGEWEGSRNYPKLVWYEDFGTITGNWFTSDASGKRKKVTGNYFEKVKKEG